MKNKISRLLIALVLTFSSIIPVFAVNLPPGVKLELSSSTISTTLTQDCKVNGTISKAYGQMVMIKDSKNIPIILTTLPNAKGASSKFEVTIKSSYIKEGTNKYTIQSLNYKDKVLASKVISFTVLCKKQNQTITASNLSATIGQSTKLNASTNSNLPLSYYSKNTNIATVDGKGNITPKSVGTTQIVITQQGNAKFSSATKTVNVTVVQNAPYTIWLNANGGSGNSIKLTVKRDASFKLPKNTFKRNGYTFVGWSDANGRPVMSGTDVTKFKNVNMKNFQLGTVKYKNEASVKNLTSSGKSVTLYAVWKGSGGQAVADWATLIAKDNEFHYGKGSAAHHRGCYYCNSQSHKKGKMQNWNKTYCCNAFVAAAWTHGANKFKKCSPDGWVDASRLKRGKDTAFKPLGKISKSKLKPGDILTHKNGHVSLYVGNGKQASAENGDNNKKKSSSWNNSILVTPLTGARWSGSSYCVDNVCRPR